MIEIYVVLAVLAISITLNVVGFISWQRRGDWICHWWEQYHKQLLRANVAEAESQKLGKRNKIMAQELAYDPERKTRVFPGRKPTVFEPY